MSISSGHDEVGTAAVAAAVPLAPTRGRSRDHLPVRVHTPRTRRDFGILRLRFFMPLVSYIGWVMVTRRMRGTWLGYLWIPLRPALNLMAKGLVFGGMLKVASGDRPYIIFLMVGQGAWDFFDKSVYWSFRTLQSERKLISSFQVPWIGPIGATLIPAAMDAAQYVVIGAAACTYYKLTRGTFYIVTSVPLAIELVAGVLLLAAWAVGISLVLAPIITKVRDVRFLLKYALGFWMYLVPIVYPISFLPAKYQGLAEYNPITAPLEMIKDGVLSTGRPSAVSMMTCVIGLLVLIPIGLFTTAHAEREAHARI